MASPKPKAKTVDKLKSTILNPALTSTYECHFNPPSDVRSWIYSRSILKLGNGYSPGTLGEKLTLSCRDAALPGTSLATHTLDNDFTGVTERHAYRRQYNPTASFTFYVDKDYDLIYFFENWIAFIVNESGLSEAEKENYSYRVNFPNEYKTDIFIRKFERDYDGRNLEYKFLNAYPISIDQMEVSYDASELLLCRVNFNFSRYVLRSKDN